MIKIVNDDFEFKAQRVTDEETKEPVMQYSAHYTVESEGVFQKRGMLIRFSKREEIQILKSIMSVVYPKIKNNENIKQGEDE